MNGKDVTSKRTLFAPRFHNFGLTLQIDVKLKYCDCAKSKQDVVAAEQLQQTKSCIGEAFGKTMIWNIKIVKERINDKNKINRGLSHKICT